MVKSKKISKTKKQVNTKVERKTKPHKKNFIDTVKTVLGQFSTIFVLNINNLRTNLVKRIREDFNDSKILFGKKKLFFKALEGNHLTEVLEGNDVLLFTERNYENVSEELAKYTSLEFARTGVLCQQSVKVLAQPLKVFDSGLAPTLRDLGMPVEIKDGVIILMQDYQICKKGEQLNNSMSRLLKFFNIQTAEFNVEIKAMLKDNSLTNYEINSGKSIENLPASVEVRCELLDDGKYYFMSHAIEEAAMDCE